MDIWRLFFGLLFLTNSHGVFGANIGNRSDELGGSGYRPELERQHQFEPKKIQRNLNSVQELSAKSIQLLSGCGEPGGPGVAYPVITVDLDGYYTIVAKANWLPPRISQTESQLTIHGIDADDDCVRDDIEHYIARKYASAEQQKIRNYLFEYAVWLNQFLVSNITDDQARTVYKNLYLSARCVIQELGSSYKTDEVFDDLFAEFHDTWPRSDRYVENGTRVSGWVTREELLVRCE